MLLNSWYTWLRISQNHEITRELKLEVASGDHSVQPDPMKQQVKQTKWIRTVSIPYFKYLKVGRLFKLSEQLLQVFTTLASKKSFF